MAEVDSVGVFPDVVQIQALEREETSVGAVEILDLVGEFQVVLLLEARIEERLEDGFFRVDAERLDKARVVQLVENLLADGLQRGHVRVEENQADTAAVTQVAEDVDEPEVREHGEHADAPGLFDGARRAAPTEEVVLVRINLDEQERPAGSVRAQEFLV